MRYVRIFLLHFQDAFQNRGRSFIWFLLSLLNPLMVLLFWRGAFQSGTPLAGWNYQSIAGYYLLLVIAGSFLQVHVEEDIARRDIQLGFLSQYLTRPFPYIVRKFFEELPWRLIQGFFGVVVFFIFSFVIQGRLQLVHDVVGIAASIIIVGLALFVSFLFKMILGISALWITEYSGLQELVGVIDVIFAGFIMPLALFPPTVKIISYILPFSYMIYFPIVSLLGKLSLQETGQAIGVQILWIAIFCFTYQALWKKGIKKFTGLGQ